MPLGSRHEEVGVVLRRGGGLVLVGDDGGVWRLDVPSGLRDLAGRRVTIAGVRVGFDHLEVERVDGRSPPRPWIMSLEFGLGVLTTLVVLGGLVVAAAHA